MYMFHPVQDLFFDDENEDPLHNPSDEEVLPTSPLLHPCCTVASYRYMFAH